MKDRWDDHIVRKRSFMHDWESDVIEVIEDPDYIYQHNRFPNEQCYYRDPSPIGNLLKVVIRIVRPNWAEIVTVHPADKVTQGETLIYERSNAKRK